MLVNKCMIADYNSSNLSRIKTGGKVAFFADVESETSLIRIINDAKRRDLPFYVIGAGSNVVLDDEYFSGIVVRLGRKYRSVEITDKYVLAGASVFMPTLGKKLATLGFDSFVYMSVIPGTIGGAVIMNAGITDNGVVSDRFYYADVLETSNMAIRRYFSDNMDFSYRSSCLKGTKNIVLKVAFELAYSQRNKIDEIISRIKRVKEMRKLKQPSIKRTFGSVFKSTKDHPAGWYLEQVGMKGMKIGGAMVANEHANWIVNTGNATSSDVKKLISIGCARVYEAYGVKLEREVIYLPQDIK